MRSWCVPRVLPAGTVAENARALAHGWQGLAFGAHRNIVVFDTRTAQVTQVLCGGHGAAVTQVAWENTRLPYDPRRLRPLFLVSGDAQGLVVLWNVAAASKMAVLDVKVSRIRGTKAVTTLEWRPTQSKDAAFGHLMVLYEPSILIMWNIATKTPLWKQDFQTPLVDLALDPFHPNRCVLASMSASIFVIDDINDNRLSDDKGKRFAVGDPAKEELRQVCFSPHSEHVVLLVFTQHILMMDLQIQQTLGSVNLERGGSPFRYIALGTRRPMLYALHENSCITVRLCTSSLGDDYLYKAQSDPLRVRASRLHALAVDLRDESNVVGVCLDGSVLMYQAGPRRPASRSLDLLGTGTAFLNQARTLFLRSVCPAVLPATCLAAAPPDDKGVVHRLAVGTAAGVVQLVDLEHGAVQLQLAACNFALSDLAWIDADRVVAMTSTEATTKSFRNMLLIANLCTGRVTTLRDKTESTAMQHLRVSPQGQYILVLFQEKAPEIYSPEQGLLTSMSSKMPVVVDIAWDGLRIGNKVAGTSQSVIDESVQPGEVDAPNAFPDHARQGPTREQFMALTLNGEVFAYSVENSAVRLQRQLVTEFAPAQYTCMTWKHGVAILGDAAGTVYVWNLKLRSRRSLTTAFSNVKNIVLAPSEASNKVLVQFSDGAAVIDFETREVLAQQPFDPKDQSEIACVGWAKDDRPILVLVDGAIRVMDAWLQICNSSATMYHFKTAVSMPYVVGSRVAGRARVIAQHQPGQPYALPEPTPAGGPAAADGHEMNVEETLALQTREYLAGLPAEMRRLLAEAPNTATRCLLVALAFGEDWTFSFWSCVLQHMFTGPTPTIGLVGATTQQKRESLLQLEPSAETEQPLAKLATSASNLAAAQATLTTAYESQPWQARLPPSFSMLQSTANTLDTQHARLALHRNVNHQHTLPYDLVSQLTSSHVKMEEHASAVNLLLQTGTSSPNVYADALRACLITAVKMPERIEPTIKMAAMSLIAGNKLSEGVELLVLVGHTLEACRYLQSYDRWDEAAVLAKSALAHDDACTVIVRHAEHLVAKGRWHTAVLHLVAVRQYNAVLSLLVQHELYDLAYLFRMACSEAGVDMAMEMRKDTSGNVMATPIVDVVRPYAELLAKLGLKAAADAVLPGVSVGPAVNSAEAEA